MLDKCLAGVAIVAVGAIVIYKLWPTAKADTRKLYTGTATDRDPNVARKTARMTMFRTIDGKLSSKDYGESMSYDIGSGCYICNVSMMA